MVFTPDEFEMNQYMKFSHLFPPMFATLDWSLLSCHFPLEPCEMWDKFLWILVSFKSCFFQNLCGHEQLIQDFNIYFQLEKSQWLLRQGLTNVDPYNAFPTCLLSCAMCFLCCCFICRSVGKLRSCSQCATGPSEPLASSRLLRSVSTHPIHQHSPELL